VAIAGPAATTRRWAGAVWWLLAASTALVWLGLGRLTVAFATASLEWSYVAEQTRVGAPWYYRVAGLWGGMAGSLLLFTGLVAVALCVAARRAAWPVQLAALITVATLAVVDLVAASPFGRERVPPTVGFGLNPILEHPAMAIHPPLLYVGLAASAGAAVAATYDQRRARRWLLATMAALTAAMTLGAAWSYVEQGWGGYWAWDPVENTSLLVWLAALVALHAVPAASPPPALAAGLAPWVLAVGGAAITRSGRTPSVHAFAEQPAIGAALAGLGLATLAATIVAVVVEHRRAGHDRRGAPDVRAIAVVLAVAGIAVVLAGTVWPVLAGRDAAVRGEFFSRTIGPLALVAVPLLAWRLRRPWGWSTVAHAGMLLLIAGVAASTFDRAGTEPVAQGEALVVAGAAVRNAGIEVGPGSRRGTEAVTAAVDVDGFGYRPALVVYPERGGRLAEVAVRPGWWTDTSVVLEGARDDGTALLTVHRRHGMWLVWLGATVVAVATLALATRARTSTGRPPPGERPSEAWSAPEV